MMRHILGLVARSAGCNCMACHRSFCAAQRLLQAALHSVERWGLHGLTLRLASRADGEWAGCRGVLDGPVLACGDTIAVCERFASLTSCRGR